MPKGEYLGELEELVLLALARLEDEAYGMSIRREIEARTGRDVAIGSVYSSLERMEDKGYIRSWVGDPTPERGGKAKRYYGLESAGARALLASRERLDALWEGLELDPDLLETTR